MKIAMLGPVGVGKGTQIQQISERLNYTRLSTGDLVRDHIEAGTELGRKLEDYYERGEPVPDDAIMDLEGPSDEELIERITSGRRQSLATGRVYHTEYDPPPDPGEGRDPGPFVQRDDDKEEALRRELEAYREEAEKIKEYYDEQGILSVVNAEQDVAEVTEDIIAALGYPEERAPRA